jgi:hypothetical protein
MGEELKKWLLGISVVAGFVIISSNNQVILPVNLLRTIVRRSVRPDIYCPPV